MGSENLDNRDPKALAHVRNQLFSSKRSDATLAMRRFDEVQARKYSPELVELILTNDDEVSRIVAVKILKKGFRPYAGRIDESKEWREHVAPSIPRMLEEEDQGIRQRIIELIGETRDPDFFDLVCSSVKDESEWVRHAAYEALVEFGDERGVGLLIAATKSEKGRLSRMIASRTLEELRLKQPLPGERR